MWFRSSTLFAAVATAAALTLALAGGARAETVTVFAAVSLKNALEDAAAAFAAAGGATVTLAFASSAHLARQIAHGAPADAFVSASVAWMDDLEARGEIVSATRRDLAANRLALIEHRASDAEDPAAIDLSGDADAIGAAIADRLDGGRLAMGFVDAAPVGMYGKAALTTLGLWEALRPRVAEADNARAALTLVARGEAPIGVVYATDARATDAVAIIAMFPSESHDPIVYPAATTKGSRRPEAASAFLDFLTGDAGRAAFARHGFLAVDDARAASER